MAQTARAAHVPIDQYLTLMFMIESAMGGFMHWGYGAGEDFDRDFFQFFAAKTADAKKKGDPGMRVTLGDLMTLLRGVAKAAEADPTSHTPAKLERTKEMLRLIQYLQGQRNRIMHGDIPDGSLQASVSAQGLVPMTAALFALTRDWISQWKETATRDEPFASWRYLELSERDITHILQKQEIESHSVSVDDNDLIFYRRPLHPRYDIRSAQFRASDHGDAELWVANIPYVANYKPRDHIENFIRNQVTGWKGMANASVAIISMEDKPPLEFRFDPRVATQPDSSDAKAGPHLFGIPVWIYAPDSRNMRMLISNIERKKPKSPAARRR